MVNTCTNAQPTSADLALAWVAAALRSERVLSALRRTECGLLHED